MCKCVKKNIIIKKLNDRFNERKSTVFFFGRFIKVTLNVTLTLVFAFMMFLDFLDNAGGFMNFIYGQIGD